MVTFRQGQLRAAAAGIGASYSSISKSYDGTFSAQRQELVEQWVNYAVLADEFTGQWVQPVWQTLVQVADMSGVLRIPRDGEDAPAAVVVDVNVRDRNGRPVTKLDLTDFELFDLLSPQGTYVNGRRIEAVLRALEMEGALPPGASNAQVTVEPPRDPSARPAW